MINLFRIDNRLIHAQVLEAWLPFAGANLLVVINDDLAVDEFRQMVMSNFLPNSSKAQFWSLSEAVSKLNSLRSDEAVKAIVIFASPGDAVSFIECGGLRPEEINVGGIHYAVGRLSLGRYQTFSDEDREALLKLVSQGVKIDARATPADAGVDLLSIIKDE